MPECRKQQINEDLHNKLLKEFDNKIPCGFGNDNCSCTYFIKNKKITRADIYKISIMKMIASIKHDLKESDITEDQKIKLNQELKIARDLLNFELSVDYIQLAEKLHDNYITAKTFRLTQEKKKIKPSDNYPWNLLTKPEQSDWVLTVTMFHNNNLILTKNGG